MSCFYFSFLTPKIRLPRSVHTSKTLIYIKHGYRYKEIINITKDKNMWMCGFVISLRNQKYYLYCVYHSPSASDVKFRNILDDFFDMTCLDSTFIVIGDFNIDLANTRF